MPRQIGNVVEKNFVAGLITDNTALNFPENACVSTDNCIFDDSGRITRRRGFDFEQNHSLVNVTKTDSVVVSHVWSEVNGDGDVKLLVVQVGTTLYFYDLSFAIISAGELGDTVNLLDHDASGASSVGADPCSFANGAGVLFVSHPHCDPFYVEYDASVGTVSSTTITVQIRDLVGVDDSLGVSERPTASVGTLSNTHKYNLFNQGWYFNSNAALTAWDTAFTTMPSNADIWWVYKNTSDVFDSTTVANRDLGNTPAPKGHYILDAFNQDRSTVSGIAGLTTITTNPIRPSAIAFYAGRVWYAGVDDSDFHTNVYFSRILEKIDQAGQCYQDNDPTSEFEPDLLPTDGGIITVHGMGNVVKLQTMGSSLLLFTTTGIWSISGSQGLGFVATDYSINKISSVPAEEVYSFIDVDGNPCWWNSEGIYIITSQDGLTLVNESLSSGTNFAVQSLTDRKIRNYIIDNIPAICRKQVVGAYNPNERIIQWLFRTEVPTTIQEISEYQKVLNYNLLTQAFYVWSLPEEHDVTVNGIFQTKGSSGVTEPLTVVDATPDTVVDGSGNTVIAYDIGGTFTTPIFLYLCSYNDAGQDKLTIAKEFDTRYRDWITYSDPGENYTSSFITGYRLPGDAQRFFQNNYVFVFLESENNSGAYVQGVYDFSNSTNSGKWSTLQQIYNSSTTLRDVNFRRLKVRGKGRSLQLRFQSEAGKPFTIIGWSLNLSGNASV